eukprot:9409613-Alexandrium_andersonii.AAC.1
MSALQARCFANRRRARLIVTRYPAIAERTFQAPSVIQSFLGRGQTGATFWRTRLTGWFKVAKWEP